MTAAKFYELLEEAGERMVWTVDPLSGFIRGRFRRARISRDFCPITAVKYLQDREYHEAIFAFDAAEDMGLNDNFAQKITMAADDCGSKKVRRHIKQVLGL
jgi:hypothetical protein